MKKALGLVRTEKVWLEQSKGVREKGNSAPPVGLEPTTSCFPGKHITTVPRVRRQEVGDDSNPCAGEQRERCYLNGKVLDSHGNVNPM